MGSAYVVATSGFAIDDKAGLCIRQTHYSAKQTLQASAHADTLDIIPISDFKPLIDIWLVQPRVLGKLQQPVERFGAAVERQFKEARAQRAA
ncbi:hypothetical protein [Paraburkholderia dipogonis]|nr:hypothetical protein [Paraburkholderia dipogonis]